MGICRDAETCVLNKGSTMMPLYIITIRNTPVIINNESSQMVCVFPDSLEVIISRTKCPLALMAKALPKKVSQIRQLRANSSVQDNGFWRM